MTKKPTLTSRELILSKAKQLFAERGFDGISVREIVGAARANVSMVNYHFGSKEGLYRECLASFGTRNLLIAQETLAAPSDTRELQLRLQMYLERTLQSHLQDPAMYRIVDQEIERRSPEFKDILEKVFIEVFKTVHDFFVIAQKRKIVHKALDPLVPTSMVQGFIRQELRTDSLRHEILGKTIKDDEFRQKAISDFTSILSTGLF